MTATVTVSGLQVGGNYALLRYDDSTQLPTNVPAAGFLSSRYTSRVDFTASASRWSHPDSFPSNGATYYRCVAQ